MKVVIAVDGSHIAQHAVRAFLELARELATPPEVHLVAVVDYAHVPAGLGKAPAAAPDLLAEDAAAALAMATEFCNALGMDVRPTTLRGHVAEQILQFAKELGAQLIVVGTHGRSGIRRTMLGSTCESILRKAAIPVLAVRHEA